ncbi:hypothetical protein [Hymenobacter jeollabukensis]|uniref:Uncharacterized protein n=1 Tax=Hymenobacter jeollabukensis TaxID=2025313 RepID=A0A5R8WPB4_9BACT|nr:hypothetical protein [Hymenobacter jeollabukensis]TLM91898.1 hypothetical protein FDY95_15210 [Hymenobacter jeollabukensis]
MPNSFRCHVLLIACCACLFFQGCQEQPAVRGPFVKTTYSDPTTEIVDHTLFELVGTDPFYEDIWDYQRRIGTYAPDDSAGQQAFLRRYQRNRKIFLRPVILVAWPRLSSNSLSRETRSIFLTAARVVTDKSSRPSEKELFDAVLYKRLLLNMEGTSLRVAEMRNTGIYTLIAPTSSVQAKTGLYWPNHDWQSSNANRTPVNQFAVSRAVVDETNTRGCLLFERLGTGSGRAEFIFVERRQGRWTLVHRFDYWTS